MQDNTPSSAIHAETFHTLLDLMGSDEFRQIIDFFHRDTASSLLVLRTAIQQHDAGKIGIICHKLKSSSQLIGAATFARYAQVLEQQSQDLNLVVITKSLLMMQKEYQAIIQWLNEHYLATAG